MTTFIYCFECISNCKVLGRKYIGSTDNLRIRYHYHLKNFKEHIHHNPELMKWYNKSNIKFKFYILELVANKKDRFVREQYWIDKYINNCFNLVDVNGNLLKKNKVPNIEYLRLNPKRTNKQQKSIKKWIKGCKHIRKYY